MLLDERERVVRRVRAFVGVAHKAGDHRRVRGGCERLGQLDLGWDLLSRRVDDRAVQPASHAVINESHVTPVTRQWRREGAEIAVAAWVSQHGGYATKSTSHLETVTNCDRERKPSARRCL